MFLPWAGGVLYRERPFSLDAVKGTGLFEPRQHGLTPEVISIPDVLRFQCTYGVTDGALYLEHFRLRLPYVERLRIRAGRGPLLFGRSAQVDSSPGARWPVVYQDLHAPTPFTGGMLLADGYLYVSVHDERTQQVREHTAHTAICWTEVHELLFQDGRLTEERDLSEATARLREELASRTDEPGGPAWTADLAARLASLFRLDYGGVMPPRRIL